LNVASETPRCCASSQSYLSQSSKSASARTALLNTTRISAAAAMEMGVRGVIQVIIFKHPLCLIAANLLLFRQAVAIAVDLWNPK
jgi:hypothetical protein